MNDSLKFATTSRGSSDNALDSQWKAMLDEWGNLSLKPFESANAGNRNVVANSAGRLILGSADDGDGGSEWSRVTPSGGVTNGGLVPKNDTDVVGIGPDARTGSKYYSLYVNGGTSNRAAAFYSNGNFA